MRIYIDAERNSVQKANIPACNKMLRNIALDLFDSFHPASLQMPAPDGHGTKFHSAPRDVTSKLGTMIAKVMQGGTRPFFPLLNLCIAEVADCICIVWTTPRMTRSVIHRVQKVYATERRRLSGTRTIARPKVPSTRAEEAAEELEKDMQALEAEAKSRECGEPSKDDTAYQLIERTFKRRHGAQRRQPADTLEAYFELYPFMSSWRMVCV